MDNKHHDFSVGVLSFLTPWQPWVLISLSFYHVKASKLILTLPVGAFDPSAFHRPMCKCSRRIETTVTSHPLVSPDSVSGPHLARTLDRQSRVTLWRSDAPLWSSLETQPGIYGYVRSGRPSQTQSLSRHRFTYCPVSCRDSYISKLVGDVWCS